MINRDLIIGNVGGGSIVSPDTHTEGLYTIEITKSDVRTEGRNADGCPDIRA